MQGLTHGDRPKITTPPSRCKNWGKVLIKKHQPYFIDHWEGTLNAGRLLAPLSPSLKPRHAWQPNSWVMINSLYPFRLNDATHEFAPLQCFAGLRRIASKFSSLQWYTSGEQMWIASEGWRGFMPSYCWDPELVVSCPLHAVAHWGYSNIWPSMGEWMKGLPC